MLNRFSQSFFRCFSFLLFTLCANAGARTAMQPAPFGPNMANMSEAEMAAFEKEMRAAEQEIQQFVNQMTPEERKKFEEEVEKQIEMMSKMNPDQLEKYITDVMTGNIPEMPVEEKPIIEEPKVETPKFEEKTTPVEKPTLVSKSSLALEKELLVAIDALIYEIHQLLQKINADKSLEQLIVGWGNKGDITNWPNHTPPAAAWSGKVKKDIESLDAALHKLKKEDPETGRHPYFSYALEAGDLPKKLEAISNDLTYEVPNIKVSSYGDKGLDKFGQQSLQKAISILCDAIYNQHIEAAITAIFEKHKPVEEKERKKAEDDSKKAIEQSKQRPVAQPTKTIGQPETGRYGVTKPTSRDDAYGYSRYGGGDYGAPWAAPTSAPFGGSSSSTPLGGGGSGSAGGGSPRASGSSTSTGDKAGDKADRAKDGKDQDAKEDGKGEKEKDGKDKNKNDKKEDGKSKNAPAKPTVSNPVLDNMLVTIQSELDTIIALAHDENVNDIDTLARDKKVNPDFIEAVEQLSQATRDAQRTLHLFDSRLKGNERPHYGKLVAQGYDALHKKDLGILQSRLSVALQQSNIDNMDATKRASYSNILSPSAKQSLPVIHKSLEDISGTIKNMATKK